MSKLNKLEEALIAAIVQENKQKYPQLESHSALLKLKKREFTGVGSFTYFQYDAP